MGSWLTLWLHQLGAKVTGYALDPPSEPNLFTVMGARELLVDDVQADIRDGDRLAQTIKQCDPSIVFHLAAQPIVLASLENPRDTFDINVLGTASVCDAIRLSGQACSVVIATSDKCYRNDGAGRAFEEADPLGGEDPYSASKAATELVAAAYQASYFQPDQVERHGVRLATVRSGNVIGGGDWATDRLVPDAVRALSVGREIEVRHPDSIRPWQHVLEPLSGYLAVARALHEGRDEGLGRPSWNFGPDATRQFTVSDLVSQVVDCWGGGSWSSHPSSSDGVEATSLRLSSEKALHDFGWRQRWDFSQTVAHTVAWYRQFYEDETASMRDHSLHDIEHFEQAAGSASQA
jgi:CDP-glucose 4,6-dehydratase